MRIIERDNEKHFVYQQSAVCTNAFIERYLQYVYKPNDVTTHLWELFDMIVIDEVHSLILDAYYQSAPFYVNDLIREYLERYEQAKDNFHLLPACKHMILMTGTPESLKSLDVKYNRKLHVIDKREECKNVVPNNIYFISKKMVKNYLEDGLKSGIRSIYFGQSITGILNYYEKFTMQDKAKIALSFSDEKRREALDEDERLLMEITEERIKTEGLLPDNVELLLSTERNKEGINIKDNISNIYVESKHMGDVIQMAGRVRSGVENMYVVLDGGIEVEEVLESYDARFSYSKAVGHNSKDNVINDLWKEVCFENGGRLFNNRNAPITAYENKWSARFVDYIHNKYEYIKYSYFRNVFEFYQNRWRSLMDYGFAQHNFMVAYNNGNITERFQKLFPNSVVHPCDVIVVKGNISVEKAIEFINENMHSGELYSINERQHFCEELNKILNTTYKKINTIFRHLNVDAEFKYLRKSGKEKKRGLTEEDKDKKILTFVKGGEF